MLAHDSALFAGLDIQPSSQKKKETERQKRLRLGIGQFLVTLVLLGVLVVSHLNPLWRLSLLFLFWASAIGYFQARDKT